MFSIIGIIIVIVAIVGGYLMEHGNIKVLIQPAELVIIGGAGMGALLIANPLPVIKGILKGVGGAFGSGKYDKALYLKALIMLNELFNKGRKGGIASLEGDVEQPDKSELFKKYPEIMKLQHAVDFICDTLRIVMTGNISPFELDQMTELDLEVHHKEVNQPVTALTTVADALPGFGIVAAVLGVVITMGSLGGAPGEIGRKVAAALVGTFLGILLCYGFLAPLAAKMGRANEDEASFYQCLRTGLLTYVRGGAPLVAVEFARRSIPTAVRPAFEEMEGALRRKPAEQAIAA